MMTLSLRILRMKRKKIRKSRPRRSPSMSRLCSSNCSQTTRTRLRMQPCRGSGKIPLMKKTSSRARRLCRLLRETRFSGSTCSRRRTVCMLETFSSELLDSQSRSSSTPGRSTWQSLATFAKGALARRTTWLNRRAPLCSRIPPKMWFTDQRS